jgi:hypothetical protein
VSTLPLELGKLVNLYFLDLYMNKLSRNLPTSLVGMWKTWEFNILTNNPTGKILGRLFVSWPELILFQVQYNLLIGKIPPEIDNGMKLNILYLYS